jgi:hypothetical protein
MKYCLARPPIGLAMAKQRIGAAGKARSNVEIPPLRRRTRAFSADNTRIQWRAVGWVDTVSRALAIPVWVDCTTNFSERKFPTGDTGPYEVSRSLMRCSPKSLVDRSHEIASLAGEPISRRRFTGFELFDCPSHRIKRQACKATNLSE